MSNKEIINAALYAGRDAIIKHLGKNASMDDIGIVLVGLVHLLVTDGGQLPISAANHNIEEFIAQLKWQVENSQKDIPNASCKALM